MKKLLLLSLLAIVSFGAFAQKSYITVLAHPYRNYNTGVFMTGDVPSDIANVYKYNEQMSNTSYFYSDVYNIGDMLNILSGYGYEVEMMVPVSPNKDEPNTRIQYLLSKEIRSNQPASDGDINKDGLIDVTDVNELVNIILGIVRQNPSLLREAR